MFWPSRGGRQRQVARGAAARHGRRRQPRRVRDRGRRARAATRRPRRCSTAASSWPSSSRARRACSAHDARRGGRGAAGAGRGGQRARRRRRVRRRAVPRPAGRLGPSSGCMRFANAAGAIVACRLACCRRDADRRDEVEAHRSGRRSVHERRRCADLVEDPRAPASRSAVAEAAAAPRRPPTRCSAADRPPDAGRGRPPGARRAARRRPPAGHGRPGRAAGAARASRCRGPGVDGVLGTADILEDLLLLGALDEQGRDRLDEPRRPGRHRRSRSTTGSPATTPRRSRGWASRAARCCCASTPTTRRPRRTWRPAPDAVSALAAAGLMAMVEPFISHRVDGRVRNDLSAEAVIRADRGRLRARRPRPPTPG